jgi:arylsulfatase
MRRLPVAASGERCQNATRVHSSPHSSLRSSNREGKPFVTAAEKPAERPNVVLICVDQWRGDCLGIDGHPVVETPALDQLALRGTRFGRAYAATPSCVPARAALMTGLDQANHGRISYSDGIPWTYPTTLAGEFSRQGYQTEAIGKLHVYPERNRVGFDHVRLHDGYLHAARNHAQDHALIDDYVPWLQRELGPDADYFDHGVNCNGVVTRPWDKPEYTHPTTWVVSEALSFLTQRDTTQPFFLYLGFHRPHPPYDPPQWAFEQYQREDMPEALVGDWVDMLEPYRNDHQMDAPVAVYPDRVRHRAQAGYYGHMTHIDHQLNRLFEMMMERDVFHNTWVCFVSDHGEMMGDHHLYRKALPYEGSARVPLILAGPTQIGLKGGVQSDALVELRDVMPTLLDCAGLEVPPGLDGRSLLPVVQGEAGGHEIIHGEHAYFGQSIQWLTDGHEKYVWWSAGGQEQLFDLDRDPRECQDLARESGNDGRLQRWRQVLVERLAGREDGHSDGTSLIPGRSPLTSLRSVLERFA